MVFVSFSLTFRARLLRSSEKNLQLQPEVESVDVESEESVGPEAGSVEPEMESAERDFFPDKVINMMLSNLLGSLNYITILEGGKGVRIL